MLVSINYRKEFQMKPVVQSLLETDLYKFTMWQALLHSHPNTQTEYAFVCRNTPAYPLAELKDDVERELDHLCSLKFTEDELDYLRSLRFIKSDFTDFLAYFISSGSSSKSVRTVSNWRLLLQDRKYMFPVLKFLYCISSMNCISAVCRPMQPCRKRGGDWLQSFHNCRRLRRNQKISSV
jgi:hypothetical protein